MFSKFDDELDSLKIDITKLPEEERQRLERIAKISLEADNLAKAAGFNVDDDIYQDKSDFITDKAVRDTNWSGQSSAEEIVVSTYSWQDVINRKGLAAGDSVALTIFAAIGKSNHGESYDLLDLLQTAAPFVISWLLVSPFLGTFSRSATASKDSLLTGLIPGWAVSIPLALVIRGTIKGYAPPVPFIIVSFVATFVVLYAWRYFYILAFGSTSDDEYKQAGFFEVFKMLGTLLKRW